MRSLFRRAATAAAFGSVALVAAEAVARIDDWIRLGIPIMRTPDYDRDLKYRDWFGIRGLPNGRYRQWRLNNFGFRGPDITQVPPPDCHRVMILGASETFGLYESNGHEYPAQLRDSLRSGGCYEVVNSSIVGAGLMGLIRLWENYSAQFQPDIVLVYPSPTFYLSNNPPVWGPMPGKAEPSPEMPFRPRLLEHLQNVWSTPDFLQRRRLEAWLAADTAGKPADWFFASPPQDRLEAFGRDLDSLVRSIHARGARPILMTHAIRFSNPPQPGDELQLLAWRRFSPRASYDVLLGFEAAAADWMRAYSQRTGTALIDVSRQVSGKTELFADFVHFTNEGAATVAGLITQELLAQPAPAGAPSEDPPDQR